MHKFNKAQLDQIKSRGIALDEINKQLVLFRKGINPVILHKPAIPGDGIEVLNDEEINGYIRTFRDLKHKFSLGKFIPASGAATRMFKDLFTAFFELKNDLSRQDLIIQKFPLVKKFFTDIEKYPFYDELRNVCLKKGTDPQKLINEKNYIKILDLLLNSSGLNYGILPKGLLKFYSYGKQFRTPMEEHLIEASAYLKNTNDQVNIHFTVSPEHRFLFEELASQLTIFYSKKGLADFKISFSVQKPSTDTLAVSMDNKPFLLLDNSLLFRPGGHGALLENLQDFEPSIIFIGNIDNVSHDRLKDIRVKYKELLGGILLQRAQKVHSFLSRMEKGIDTALRSEITGFIQEFISSEVAKKLQTLTDKDYILKAKEILNKPIRVCGIVKNTGDPGGGPFWIADRSGHSSKQIIESSQIDMSDPLQSHIFNSSTHFNPVDLACFTRDFKGNKFKFKDYSDSEMAFIAIKSQGGIKLKALELPGLWNGAMAGWMTFFVEVPEKTFSPVKTVFDLLRSGLS